MNPALASKAHWATPSNADRKRPSTTSSGYIQLMKKPDIPPQRDIGHLCPMFVSERNSCTVAEIPIGILEIYYAIFFLSRKRKKHRENFSRTRLSDARTSRCSAICYVTTNRQVNPWRVQQMNNELPDSTPNTPQTSPDVTTRTPACRTALSARSTSPATSSTPRQASTTRNVSKPSAAESSAVNLTQ